MNSKNIEHCKIQKNRKIMKIEKIRKNHENWQKLSENGPEPWSGGLDFPRTNSWFSKNIILLCHKHKILEKMLSDGLKWKSGFTQNALPDRPKIESKTSLWGENLIKRYSRWHHFPQDGLPWAATQDRLFQKMSNFEKSKTWKISKMGWNGSRKLNSGDFWRRDAGNFDPDAMGRVS